MTSPVEYQAVIDRIESLSRQFDEKLAQVDPAFQAGMRVLDNAAELLGDLVKPLKDALITLKRWVDAEMHRLRTEFAKFKTGFNVLFVMMEWDDKWLEIRNLANAVAAKLERPQDRLDRHWEGSAATKYFSIVTPQVDAARRIGSMAEKTSSTLQDMATAGLVFYAALATAMAVVIGGLITAIAGLAGGVTAPAGVAGVVVALGAAVALAAAAYNFMAQQDKAGSLLEGEAANPVGFAAGPSWPKAAAVSDDVTKHDGDEADWKPKRP